MKIVHTDCHKDWLKNMFPIEILSLHRVLRTGSKSEPTLSVQPHLWHSILLLTQFFYIKMSEILTNDRNFNESVTTVTTIGCLGRVDKFVLNFKLVRNLIKQQSINLIQQYYSFFSTF